MLRHIRQRNGYDCGIACAAIATGRTYAHALRESRLMPARLVGRGLYARELSWLLQRLTGERWEATMPWWGWRLFRVLQAASEDAPVILLVDAGDEDMGHFMVYDGTYFYDPHDTAPRRASIKGLSLLRIIRRV